MSPNHTEPFIKVTCIQPSTHPSIHPFIHIRHQQLEADEVGVLLCAKAGYDPAAAIRVSSSLDCVPIGLGADFGFPSLDWFLSNRMQCTHTD